MIPVLFKANATAFNTFGIGVLKDCTFCEVTEERNGAYECQLKYPITGALYKELAPERLIKAKPNDTAKDQMFRIYRISTPIDGVVTVYAQHLSYDLSNIAALQWSEESISPTLAMERVFANTATPHGFTCQTDYSAAKPFAVSKPQSVRACLGGVAGSFLDQWGGEFEWDNFHVCDSHHVNEETLQRTYLAAISEMVEDSEEIMTAVRESAGLVLQPENEETLNRIGQEIIEVQEAVLALHKAKQSCSVSATDYATRIQAYSQRMQELETKQEEQKSVATRYAEVKAWLDAFEKHISDGTIMDADDSTILKQLVEQIIVGSSGIEIQFKCGVSIEKDYE